ncbi:MAG: hypothetical protein JSW58_15095 [Candidatus Latescibacterota bacterium]|nr:MAG: hypothetical protein JSW58_15095 [Candidatus Latescibacterota bacterium]
MSKTHSLVPLVAACLIFSALDGWAVETESEPPTVISTTQGLYEVHRSGKRLGSETFIERVLSSNTVIIESTYDVLAQDSAFVTGNNRLEYEEDSGFPRSYYTQKKIEKDGTLQIHEATAKMFANVVVWENRVDDVEQRQVLELPTGCLFVEGNVVHHVTVVLDRYNASAGGKQTYRAFDPMGGRATNVMLEYIGESTIDAETPGPAGLPRDKQLSHYKYFAGRLSQADIFVNSAGFVVRVDVENVDMEYVLVSVEQHNGDFGSSQ